MTAPPSIAHAQCTSLTRNTSRKCRLTLRARRGGNSRGGSYRRRNNSLSGGSAFIRSAARVSSARLTNSRREREINGKYISVTKSSRRLSLMTLAGGIYCKMNKERSLTADRAERRSQTDERKNRKCVRVNCTARCRVSAGDI